MVLNNQLGFTVGTFATIVAMAFTDYEELPILKTALYSAFVTCMSAGLVPLMGAVDH